MDLFEGRPCGFAGGAARGDGVRAGEPAGAAAGKMRRARGAEVNGIAAV